MNKNLNKKTIAWIQILIGALIAILPFFLIENALIWTEVILGILVLIFGFISIQED